MPDDPVGLPKSKRPVRVFRTGRAQVIWSLERCCDYCSTGVSGVQATPVAIEFEYLA